VSEAVLNLLIDELIICLLLSRDWQIFIRT